MSEQSWAIQTGDRIKENMEKIEHYFKAANEVFQIPSNEMILSAASELPGWVSTS